MNDNHNAHHVRIHIDQKPHNSPNPTTGPDLYELGQVREGLVLYREVEGDQEDKLVRIDSPKIDLTEDQQLVQKTVREFVDRDVMPVASEPAEGSVMVSDARPPSSITGNQRFFCSSVPKSITGLIA